MTEHSIATPEQHAHELAALELLDHPVVRKAHDDVRARWLDAVDPGPDMRACFEWASREVMFSAVVWSSNQDPLRPKITCITRLGHPVNGVDVPGSRWGIDNPDSIYRVIPISGGQRYVLRGRVAERRMTENYFTLWDPKMNTIDVLSGHDLVLDADRRFEISVDDQPANGRANHIQSNDAAQEFYIRDVMLAGGAFVVLKGADDRNWETAAIGAGIAALGLLFKSTAKANTDYCDVFPHRLFVAAIDVKDWKIPMGWYVSP